MNRLSQKLRRIAFRASVGASLAVPAVLGMANKTLAAALTKDQFFGGTAGSDAAFAGSAGLNTGGAGGLTGVAGKLINMAMGFLGIIAVMVILLGGFKWMTSGGNDEKVKKAKALIFQGIIGLAIVLSAFAITTFVISNVITITT